MHSQAIKIVVVWICSVLMAFVVGVSIADGDYGILVFSVAAISAGFGVVRRDYLFLILLGLLSPFIPPIPKISGLPFLLPMLGLCLMTMALERALVKRKVFGSVLDLATPLVVCLLAIIALRYGLKPALPNFAGFGDSVTGFRGYLSYGLCFLLLGCLGLAIRTREELIRLFKVMAGLSAFFIALLAPLTFATSETVVALLRSFGLFVGYFDNGWLRFVVLPGFGITLIALCLLPTLAPLWIIRYRRTALVAGSVAVVLGGGRSSLMIAVLTVTIILLLKKRLRALTGFAAALAVVIFVLNLLANSFLAQGKNVSFMRVLAIFNSRVAEATDADANITWRMARWELATSQIMEKPCLGWGYGGLENAFLWGDREQMEAASVEIDVVSGSVHNGYLASAWALGIPFVGLFVVLVLSTMASSVVHHSEMRQKDPFLADVHGFVLASLGPQLFGIYVGSDLNNPIIWLPIGISLVARRFGASSKIGRLQAAIPDVGRASDLLAIR